jgi:dihydroorotate dehydrogenase (fumarate)/dihydroorotate dehydrogenase
MTLYTSSARPLLFRFDAERVHEATLELCGRIGRSRLITGAARRLYAHDHPRLRTTVAGIDFPNPVGLAAGFDKNGVAAAFLPALGFGAIEIGSVSAEPSPGNPERPRLYRVPADEGLMVYYGVPNQGAPAVAARLDGVSLPVPLGVSLVETNRGAQAPTDAVIEELAQAAQPFLARADYLVLNLNCPNSGGGFSHFDDAVALRALLDRFKALGAVPPLFLKITPKPDPATARVLEAVAPFAFMKGFILNTPAPRPYTGLNTPNAELAVMRGSLTGMRVRQPSQAALRRWSAMIDRSRHVLIGVGGISSAEDAYAMIRFGASLVQVCTALVYRGPGLVKEIKRGLARLLERDGFESVAEAVGTAS